MPEPNVNVITFTGAAKEKGVARSTIYRAAWRGELNTVDIGGSEVILKDAAWENWTPQPTGKRARAHKDNDE